MEDWQKRVIKEKQDLDVKRAKLDLFMGSKLYTDIETEQKLLLADQYIKMTEYSHILGRRIETFK